MNDERRTTNDQRPTTDDGRRTTDDERGMTKRGMTKEVRRTINSQQPTDNSQQTVHNSPFTIHNSQFINPTLLPPTSYLILLITLLGFGLRVWNLHQVPPGWRDDELIEALVISQKVLAGDIQVYYPDASGHEGLYHILAAGMLALLGPGVPGIRWLSAIMGALTIPLTYLIGRRLFGAKVGLLAAALLAVSFWSLMYSRFGIRHISMPLLMLACFFAFLKAIRISRYQLPITSNQLPITNFLLAGLFMGLGFYTYFAARGVPLILLAFCAHLWLFERDRIRRHWRGLGLMFGLAFLLALPLAVTLSRQPEAEARISEVGKPLTDALAGDFALLQEYTLRTLSMFHSDGDDEWLYNIPYRPVFGPVGAVFFWLGVALALWRAAIGMWRVASGEWRAAGDAQTRSLAHSQTPKLPNSHTRTLAHSHTRALANPHVFLLLWWFAGITPGFLSIPAGSLSHTIVAQSAVYILAALPLASRRTASGERRVAGDAQTRKLARLFPLFLALLLLSLTAYRDLRDYFTVWPERGMVRFLYRADVQDVARYLNENPGLDDFAISGLLAGPWDRLALELDLTRPTAVPPRWYHPERALFIRPAVTFAGYPLTPGAYADFLEVIDTAVPGDYTLFHTQPPLLPDGEPVCFVNGLCLLAREYEAAHGRLHLLWQVGDHLELPPLPVISNPPPPGIYAGPRLYVFAHLLDAQDNWLAGDDGFWVDPATLRPGDRFIQWHYLPPHAEMAGLQIGLYDPMNGERILTVDGREAVRR